MIPNWTDTSGLLPQPRDNAWAREHGLVDKFVVMHSGNIGHAQDLDTLIRAATFLRDLEDLRIVLIGGGARRDELKELAKLLEVDQVRFMGYQPRELLAQSLSAADVHVVGLARGLAGYVVPEPPVRRAGDRPARDRHGGTRERDGEGGRAGRLQAWSSRRGGRSSSRKRFARRTTASSTWTA